MDELRFLCLPVSRVTADDACNNGRDREGLEARTLTVFAHKLAGEKSTLKFHLSQVGCEVTSCYKGQLWRNKLEKDMLEANRIGQVPEIGVRLAQQALLLRGNRGFFL